MKKVRCEVGHFFDLDRFAACPVCGKENDRRAPVQVKSAPKDGEPKTMLLWGAAEPAPSGIETGPGLTRGRAAELWDPDVRDPAPGHGAAAAPAAAVQKVPPAPRARIPDEPHPLLTTEPAPPLAWLVGLTPPYRGHAFTCTAERSQIGKSREMDIVLSDAPSVAEELHAEILFDPSDRSFSLQAGAGLTYLNGTLLLLHGTLRPYDKIRLGQVEFVFLPLCGERFSWNESISLE